MKLARGPALLALAVVLLAAPAHAQKRRFIGMSQCNLGEPWRRAGWV